MRLVLPAWPLNPVVLSASASTRARRLAAGDARCRIEKDVVYSSERRLAMDMYEPDQGEGPFPAVILLHGGGFTRGDKSRMRPIAGALASRGYVVFSINYRLVSNPLLVVVPENNAAALEDAEEALRYVKDHAGRFRIDPSRIAVFGASAGGNLAAMIGWRWSEPETDGIRVAAVVCWSGPLDLYAVAATSPVVIESVSRYLPPGRYDEALSANRAALLQASPMMYVGPRVPPTFLANSRKDVVPLRVAREAAGKLRDAGVPYELLVLRRGHGLGYRDRALGPTISFLDRHLRADGSPGAGPAVTRGGEAGDGRWARRIAVAAGSLVAVLGAGLPAVRAIRGRHHRNDVPRSR